MKRLFVPFFATLISMLLFPLSSANAIESPWGILINPDTKQCADLWSGEDYGKYAYVEGWEIMYPQPNSDGMFQILVDEDTVCDYTDGNEACCDDLGYEFLVESTELVREAPELYIDSDEVDEDEGNVTDDQDNDEESSSVVDFLRNNVYLVILFSLVIIGVVGVAIFLMMKNTPKSTKPVTK